MLTAVLLGLVVGVVIGGLGGGGGVLTVPALVYLLGQTAQDATTSSVVIVGITAAVGTLSRARGRLIEWRTALAFGTVGIPSATIGTLLNQHVAEPVLLLAFAALTVLAAIAMIVDSRRSPATGSSDPAESDPPGTPGASRIAVAAPPRAVATAVKIVLYGLVIGFLTGFLGVGGGFLMVPVLVIVLRLPMSCAVGTSLLIIAINSAAAFAARAGVAEFDWAVLVPFTVAAVLGSFVGKRVSDRLSGAALGRAFAVLLLLVGCFVAIESLLSL